MATYKRYNGKKVKRGDKNYDKGTWYMRFRVRGKEIYRSIPEATTLKEAKIAEQAVKNLIFQEKYGQFVDNTTFGDFVESVYLDYVEQHNVNTYSKKIFIQALVEYFGEFRLKDLTPQDCRNYIALRKRTPTIHGRRRSNASINKELSTLSKILNLAIEERKIETNPMAAVKMLKEAKPRERILSIEERARFDAVVAEDPILYPLSAIAMHTGLRKGQILAIRIEDIDFDREILQASASKGREPRPVPLNGTMIRLFRQLVIEAEDGEVFPFNDFRHRWNNAMKKADIADFTFHDLKHAFGTELVKRGNSPELVQLLFAHSDMSVTDIYINQKIELMRQAVTSLDDVTELGEV